MGVAKVAIIGRPNVGKSSIFNWLVGERVSIVDSVAGVTRDRVSFLLDIGLDGVDEKYLVPELTVDDEDDQYVSDETYDSPEPEDAESELSDDNLLDFEDEDVPFEPIVNEEQKNGDFEEEEANEFEDEIVEAEEISLEEEPETPKISARYIELIDSGGIGIVDKDDLSADVEQQIQAAIDMADLILFVVDARDGLAPLDEYVAERLRKLQVPIILVANKCDGETQEYDSREFHRFGWGVVSVSAKQKRGRVALMDAIEKALPVSAFFDGDDDHLKEPEMKIAIVGRRNVGKSTFVNTLAHEERVIASPIPGTTRDCVDVRFEMNGKTFIAIDTPGFMRKKSLGSDLDFYALTRAERSIRMADVVFMFFDCSLQIAKMDKQLVSLIESYNKPCIFVVNKWDKMAAYKMPTERWADYLRETFATMWHVPIAFITGMTGKNVSKLLQHAGALFRQSKMRVSTNRLNKLIAAALNHTPPPLFHFHKPKIYYATQISVSPPTIVLFCNMPDAFSPSYRRFLLNVIRDELPIGEVPIRLWFRKRDSEDRKDEIDRERLT
ncbi:MAG: ribosome biogenesis GTPase Der [Thermoguttaceae bacterium]|nr:ribosome biogenesis GTPase Der [Thermoguttaceae bacterium]